MYKNILRFKQKSKIKRSFDLKFSYISESVETSSEKKSFISNQHNLFNLNLISEI